MKHLKTSIHTAKKAVIILAVVILTWLSTPLHVSAADTTNTVAAKAEVEYLDSKNNEDILFRVSYQLNGSEILDFRLSDTEGYVFYESAINSKQMDQKFLFTDAGRQPVQLLLTFRTTAGTFVQEVQLQKK